MNLGENNVVRACSFDTIYKRRTVAVCACKVIIVMCDLNTRLRN